MTMKMVLTYLLIWCLIGFAAFSGYVFLAFKTGLVYTARKQDGTLKERIPMSGVINMMILLIAIVAFQCLANYFGIVQNKIGPTFFSLFLLNYGHYFILFLFDSLVIDGLVLSLLRPKFLNLPDAIGRESMKKHILVSMPIGLLAGFVLVSISTSLSFFIMFG